MLFRVRLLFVILAVPCLYTGICVVCFDIIHSWGRSGDISEIHIAILRKHRCTRALLTHRVPFLAPTPFDQMGNESMRVVGQGRTVEEKQSACRHVSSRLQKSIVLVRHRHHPAGGRQSGATELPALRPYDGEGQGVNERGHTGRSRSR